jgi:hypothetical protein
VVIVVAVLGALLVGLLTRDGGYDHSADPVPPPRPTHHAGPGGVPRTPEAIQAVDQFAATLRAQHPLAEPLPLWRSGLLTVVTDATTRSRVRGIDGRLVGGLRVQVVPEAFSEAQYAAFVRRLDRARFRDHRLVVSSASGGRRDEIQVGVRRLERLSDVRRAALRQRLVRLGRGIPVGLVPVDPEIVSPAG